AIPIGYWIGHTGRGKQVAVAFSGAARALPSLGLLTILTLLVGVGDAVLAATVVIVVLGVPAVLAGPYAGSESVDRGRVSAGGGRLWRDRVRWPGRGGRRPRDGHDRVADPAAGGGTDRAGPAARWSAQRHAADRGHRRAGCLCGPGRAGHLHHPGHRDPGVRA